MALNLLNYFYESSIAFILLFLVYLIFFSKYKNLRFNRFYLLSSVFFALTLPFFTLTLGYSLPDSLFNLQRIILLPEVLVTPTIIESQQETSIGSGVSVLVWIYLSGFLVLLVRFAYRIGTLYYFIKKNIRYGTIRSFYVLIPTHGKVRTCSFFNYLLWDNNQEYTEEEQKLIIQHEETHIKHKHSYDILLAEILTIVFWFNPAVYFYRSALSALHEFIADEKASLLTTKSRYISLLSLRTLKNLQFTLGNNFHQIQIFKRMNMLKSEKRRTWSSRLALTLPVITLLFYLFACEKDNVESQPVTNDGIVNDEIAASSKKDDGKVFSEVDEQPVPEGGLLEFYQYVMNELQYPESARTQKIEGKVFVEFVVDTDGTITDVKVLKGIGGGCDEEALRVVKNSPKWNPGRVLDKAVKTKMILPVSFSLDAGDKVGEVNKENASLNKKSMPETVVVGK